MYLGVKAVLVKSFARIHRANLINFGILPLEFADPADYDAVEQGDMLVLDGLRAAIAAGSELRLTNVTKGRDIAVRHTLSPRQVEIVLAGGLLNYFKQGGS